MTLRKKESMMMISKLNRAKGSGSGTDFPTQKDELKEGVLLEKLVAIIDVMQEYAKRLALYLNNSREFPYRAVVFSDVGEVKSYRDKNAIYGILATEQMEREVLELAAGTDIQLLWLSETKEVPRGALFRYSSAKEMLNLFKVKEVAVNKIPMFGFFSPAGGCEAEYLSRKIADELGKNGKILYIPFFSFGIYGREGGDGLSEAVFFLQQEGRLNGHLPGLLQRGEFVDFIGPMRWYTDGNGITKEDLETLCCPELWDTEYGGFMIAVGQFDKVGREILNLCDRVFVPVWEHEEGKRIQNEFRRQLKESGQTGLYSAILEFPVREPLSETIGEAVQNAIKREGTVIGECP